MVWFWTASLWLGQRTLFIFPFRGRQTTWTHETIQHGCHWPTATSLHFSNQRDLFQPCNIFDLLDARNVDAGQGKALYKKQQHRFSFYPQLNYSCGKKWENKSRFKRWDVSLSACLEMRNQLLRDSIIWWYANDQFKFPDCGCSRVCNMAASCSQKPFPSVPVSKTHGPAARARMNLATQTLCWQSGRQAGTHFLLLLPSSGHTFFVTLRFSLQEIVTKDEDKKTITCPEQLISVSCICVSAKILPYTETLRRGPSKPVQGLRALSSDWA